MAKKTRRTQQDYEIGFQKPPKATQFAKGQSGNPNGRPKGKRSLATTLQEALAQKVTIQENGRTRTVTKLQAIAMQLVNRAAAGDRHFIRMATQPIVAMEATLDQAGMATLSNEQDRNVLAGWLKRFQHTDAEILGTPGPDDSKGKEE